MTSRASALSTKPKSPSNDAGARISSIESRRILAVLQDTASRIDFSLILSSLEDFLEGKSDVAPEVQEAHDEFLTNQRALLSVMTADGEPKPGYQQDFEELREIYKESSRGLIRVLRIHSDYFAPLLAQSTSSGGATVKITSMFKDLNSMEVLRFSTPVEIEEKQNRLVNDIKLRKRTNKEQIDQLKIRDSKTSRERDALVREKEEEFDTIRQLLIQAKATESSLTIDETPLEDEKNSEEAIRIELGGTKEEAGKTQKTNTEDEGKMRRGLRKEEEAVQTLIQKYDSEMQSLLEQNRISKKKAEEIEADLLVLSKEVEEIMKKREPMQTDERIQSTKLLAANKLYQDMISSSVRLQLEIRRFLKTAPKATKKKKGKSGRVSRK